MGLTRQEIAARVVRRAMEDDAFRARLVADADAAIADEIGGPIPDGLKVTVLEETDDEMYLMLPQSKVETAELADEELDRAAGGGIFGPPPGHDQPPV
jgi:hypothetical protein